MPLVLYPDADGVHVIQSETVRKALGLLLRVSEFHWLHHHFLSDDHYADYTQHAIQAMLDFAKLAEKVRRTCISITNEVPMHMCNSIIST